MNKRQKNSKYFFQLSDIDISKVMNKYGISMAKNEDDESEPVKTTKLSELTTQKGTPEVISFLDESKRKHTCNVSMIDFDSKMNVNLLRYNCFWCKHPFNSRPIGCPIKYVSSQAVKTYHSHISKDTYTIKQDVTKKSRVDLIGDTMISLNVGEYYETDGVFCSFNCCQSFIRDHKHKRLYDQSYMLLMKMYNSMMNTKTVKISSAPHWRTLEPYGGNLNILAFRDGFNKVDYECHGTSSRLPRFIALTTLYEEKIKF
uniref:MYM-type domain-containing protein n=1 Tax=viral metagenome TaxID=1070528 RepID=A0A6C0LWU6_9ZZZZ